MELREHILETYDYDRSTGEILRKAGAGLDIPRSALKISRLDSNGKPYVVIKGKRYNLARLVWLIEKGELPTDRVLHANKDGNDNRISNLYIKKQQIEGVAIQKKEVRIEKAKLAMRKRTFAMQKATFAMQKATLTLQGATVAMQDATDKYIRLVQEATE